MKSKTARYSLEVVVGENGRQERIHVGDAEVDDLGQIVATLTVPVSTGLLFIKPQKSRKPSQASS